MTVFSCIAGVEQVPEAGPPVHGDPGEHGDVGQDGPGPSNISPAAAAANESGPSRCVGPTQEVAASPVHDPQDHSGVLSRITQQDDGGRSILIRTPVQKCKTILKVYHCH